MKVRMLSSGQFNRSGRYSVFNLPKQTVSGRYFGITDSKSLYVTKFKKVLHSPFKQKGNMELMDKNSFLVEDTSEYKIFDKYINLQNSRLLTQIENAAPYKKQSLCHRQKNRKISQIRFTKKSQNLSFSKYFSKLYKDENMKRSGTSYGRGKWNKKLNKLIFNCNDLMNGQTMMRKYCLI